MTPWVKRLLIANFAIFFVTRAGWSIAVGQVALTQVIEYWGAFTPSRVLIMPWSFVTYQFLHAGWVHIIFNMLILFIFGPRLEMRLGGRNFISLYLFSGIMGAFLYLLTSWGSPGGMIGASGAVFGVQLGFAYFWPREKLWIWGIFPVEARVMVVVLTAGALYFGIRGGGGIAHFAHLGGFLGAFLYLKYLEHNSPAKKWQRKIRPQAPVGHGGNHSDMERWTRIRPDDLHPVNRDEVIRLLDKARQHGASALTPTERDTLNRFTPILH